MRYMRIINRTNSLRKCSVNIVFIYYCHYLRSSRSSRSVKFMILFTITKNI